MVNPQNYTCPQCGQVDRVEKVSALVGAGTSAGFYAGHASGGGVIAGISQTNLSQKLSPPVEPVYKTPWGGCSISTVIIGLVMVIAMIILPLSTGTLNDIGVYIIVLLIVCLPVALVLWRKSVESSARQAYVTTEHPRWERAMVRWKELYYCARNDVVFIPGELGACASASEMARLL